MNFYKSIRGQKIITIFLFFYKKLKENSFFRMSQRKNHGKFPLFWANAAVRLLNTSFKTQKLFALTLH
jgi:hypothetical protein